jgi:hypothetical protein
MDAHERLSRSRVGNLYLLGRELFRTTEMVDPDS